MRHHRTSRGPSIRSAAWVLAMPLCGCLGEVSDGTPGPGPGGIDDPNVRPPGSLLHYECTDPTERGHADRVMRRFSRDELVQTLTSIFGASVMDDADVRLEVGQFPPESRFDLVYDFDEGHVLEHAQAMLTLAEAIVAHLATDAAARSRVFGECATPPDRACAEAFLDSTAVRLLGRPLSPERRASYLAGFEVEGMDYMLTILLQAPELAFHLDVQELECSVPESTSFAWNDASVRWASGGGDLPPREVLTETGWYVWEVGADRVPAAFTEVAVEVEATSADEPILVNLNVNDRPVLAEHALAGGANTLSGSISIRAGDAVKVGLQFINPGAGRSLRMIAMRLSSDAAVDCTVPAPSGGLARVDSYTVASRLSYALTGTGPDAELLGAARAGSLGTLEDVRPHAERLAASPGARRQFESLLTSWLLLEKAPDPNAAVAATNGIEAMGLAAEARRELLDYATHQIFDAGVDAEELLAAAIGFPRTERMASLYGSEIAPGDEPVPLPQGHGGLLGRIAPMLAGNLWSSPVLRGAYVRHTLLCEELPLPASDVVDAALAQIAAIDRRETSNRGVFTEVTSPTLCATCHSAINPLGFALESFDLLGRRIEQEAVYDTSGNVVATHPLDTFVEDPRIEPGGPDSLSGPEDLIAAIAESDSARACLASRLVVNARLRPVRREDSCAIAEVETALRDGASVRDAWLAAVVNEELFVRSVAEPEADR
jgi:hypothetical protein